MKKKVLITGASGFVGYHLIQEALDKGLDVVAAVRSSSKVDHLQSLPIGFTTLDFGNRQELVSDIKEKSYHYIIHAAGVTKAGKREEYEKVNAMYTRNIALAASESGIAIEKFVLMSSLAALGPVKEGGQSPVPNPVTSYGRSKLLAERHLAEVDIPYIVLRPTAVYGPRERDIFLMLKAISRGLEFYIGRGEQQLSFIHVKDLSAVAVRALTSLPVNKTYNITDGRSYDRYALGNITKELLGKRTIKLHLPVTVTRGAVAAIEAMYSLTGKTLTVNREKLNELTAANWYYAIDEAKNDLGFEPQYNLNDGLRQTLQWYKQQQWI